MPDNSSALELSFLMGKLLLENGAEISRVQETMERVAKSYGVDSYNVYVLSNAIFANGCENGVEHKTEIKFVPSSSIHFGRIAAVNQLSREIVDGKYNVGDAYRKAEDIINIPYTKVSALILACGIGSACFCYIFGGSIFDSLAALICGLFVQLFLSFAEKMKISKFITNLFASGIVSFIAIILVTLGLGGNLDMVIVGSIIRLVPGVALTTAIRDFLNGDYLSGTIRMIDALLIGGCIAIGVGVVIKVFSMLGGGIIL